MNEEQLIERFFQVVAQDLRHKHYGHTVKKHKKYLQLVAGVDLDKLLKQFVRREDKKLFEQRVELTQHIVTSVCKNLLDVFYKVPRSNSGRRLISHKNGNEGSKKAEKIEEILSKFWGEESYDDYMSTRWIELNAIDPNSFVLFEFKPFDADTEHAQPYPYEVSSKAAVDYKYTNGKLDYLVAMDSHTIKAKTDDGINPINKGLKKADKKKKAGRKFTLYGPIQNYRLLEVHESTVSTLGLGTEGVIAKSLGPKGEEISHVKLGTKFYQFEAFDPHGLEQVQGFRVGYYRDLATNGETFVNPLHAIEPYLFKTIKVNSELDLVASLLAMPKEIRYGSKCEADGCHGGTITDTNKECTSCHGTGVKPSPTTSADGIVLPMPKSKDTLIPLDDIFKTHAPDVAIIKWQQEYIEHLTQKAKRTMFNSDTFSKAEVAKTATGENLDAQNVYDTLYPFATRFCKLWRKGVMIQAKITDLDKGLLVRYSFGKDMKLKSLDTLIVDLGKANEVGNSELTRYLNDDIAQIIFSEKPTELQRYQVKDAHAVFSGKTEKEVIILMASPYVSKNDKVLYANFGKIFDDLELETEGKFYQLNKTKQKEAIAKKVAEYVELLDAENPAPTLDLGE